MADADEDHHEDADHEDADHEDADQHADDHALDPEDLQYPEFVFEEGEIDDRGGFDLERELSREELREWLEDLAGGLGSHDVAVESPDGYVTFGVGAGSVELAFEPGEDLVGELEFTVRLKAKPMFVADDPTLPKVGARGGKGFVPLELLTSEKDIFRCYGWIDDPTDP